MQGFLGSIFYIVVLIMSVVVHEVAHGFAAESQGDPTARYAGRLTMNPLRHLDMVGSVILPLLLVLFHAGFMIGWAKPVPYNERNLRNKRWGTAIVASAGILVNLCLAILFGLLIRVAPLVLGSSAQAFTDIASVIVIVNLVLALFNLIPIPPLDGSKILFSLFPRSTIKFQAMVEYLSLPLLILFLFYLWPLIFPFVGTLFTFITGTSLGF
ncbi:MAG: site-2 protease family protein [bacterium]